MPPYFTKENLIEANDIAIKRGYNRSLTKDIASVSDGFYPVVYSMLHEHAAGLKVDPHMRCVVNLGGFTVTIDCDLRLFKNLKTFENHKPQTDSEVKMFKTENAEQLIKALTMAIEALNTAPKFKVGDTDSYAIAAACTKAVFSAKAAIKKPEPVTEMCFDLEAALKNSNYIE